MDTASLGGLDESKGMIPIGSASGMFAGHPMGGGASNYFKNL